jgi:predicted negative regulator of RcsB-dependent stress response
MQLSQQTISLGLIASIMLAVILVLGLMFGWPMYSVWQQGKKGEAE